jgi:hypothetical protein
MIRTWGLVCTKTHNCFTGGFLYSITPAGNPASAVEFKNPPTKAGGFSLPDEDSNLDKQNQNLSYCLYTIGHQPEEQPQK